jgi:hypothetical protein
MAPPLIGSIACSNGPMPLQMWDWIDAQLKATAAWRPRRWKIIEAGCEALGDSAVGKVVGGWAGGRGERPAAVGAGLGGGEGTMS